MDHQQSETETGERIARQLLSRKDVFVKYVYDTGFYKRFSRDVQAGYFSGYFRFTGGKRVVGSTAILEIRAVLELTLSASTVVVSAGSFWAEQVSRIWNKHVTNGLRLVYVMRTVSATKYRLHSVILRTCLIL